MKLLIMQFSPLSRHFIPLQTKYSPSSDISWALYHPDRLSSAPPGKCWDSTCTSKYTMSVSFHILANLLSTHHLTIQCCIVYTTDNTVKP
jgi:hypothetical protein